MILARTDTAATVTLPDDYYWEDEYRAPVVVQTVADSLTGAALIQEAVRQWRPLTLRPWSDGASWLPQTTLATLRAWSAVPGLTMTLTRLGVAHAVQWRHDTLAVDPEPVTFHVNDTIDPSQDPQYRVTLRFLVV